jgi:hypothetical protein
MVRSRLFLVPVFALGAFTNTIQAVPLPPRVISIPQTPQLKIPVPPHATPAEPAVVVPPAHATVKLPSVRVTAPLLLLEQLMKNPPEKPK